MKKCCKCKLIKPFNDFAINTGRKDGRQSCCRKCNTLYCNERYNRIKHIYAQKYIFARNRNRAYVYNYLKTHFCVDCGEKDPIVLEFDHVRGEKKRPISLMINRAVAIKTLQNEIDKCEIRCANCHRRKTSKEYGYYRSLMKDS